MPLLPKSRKARRRLMAVGVAAPILAAAVGLSLYAMGDAAVFFYSPSDAQAKHVPAGKLVRIGGLVQPGSVKKLADGRVEFAVADKAAVAPVSYRGDLPDLFREGQGVVAQGAFDHGQGELSDAASALDWAQTINPEAKSCWIAGFSFGAWIGMQLLMRRPEISGWVSVAPPANHYDFGFLAPCPCGGLMLHGDTDELVPEPAVRKLVDKLNTQKNVQVDYRVFAGADHVFATHAEEVGRSIEDHVGRIVARKALALAAD